MSLRLHPLHTYNATHSISKTPPIPHLYDSTHLGAWQAWAAGLEDPEHLASHILAGSSTHPPKQWDGQRTQQKNDWRSKVRNQHRVEQLQLTSKMRVSLLSMKEFRRDLIRYITNILK